MSKLLWHPVSAVAISISSDERSKSDLDIKEVLRSSNYCEIEIG